MTHEIPPTKLLSLSLISYHQPKSLIMDPQVKNCFGWNVKKVWVEKNLF